MLANCANVLREEQDLAELADQAVLEAMYHCLLALRLAEHDAPGAGAKAETQGALKVRQNASAPSPPS